MIYEFEIIKKEIEDNADFYDEDDTGSIELPKVLAIIEKHKNTFELKSILGYSIPDVVKILNGLELERKLDLKVTMENIEKLATALQDDFYKNLKLVSERLDNENNSKTE